MDLVELIHAYCLEKFSMRKEIYITAIDGITPDGWNISEFGEHTSELNVGSTRVRKIEGFQFYKYKYKVNTRIDKSAQLCIHSTANVLNKVVFQEQEQTGIITVSKYGCPISKEIYLEQLKTYEDPCYVSPKDFVQSICNIPNAMAAIEFGFKGACNHYVGSYEASIAALWNAYESIQQETAKTMFVTSFDTVSKGLEAELEKKKNNVIYHENAMSLVLQDKTVDTVQQDAWKIESFWFGMPDVSVSEVIQQTGVVLSELGGILYCGESFPDLEEKWNIPVFLSKEEYFSSSLFYYIGILTYFIKNDINVEGKLKQLANSLKDTGNLLCICKTDLNMAAVYVNFHKYSLKERKVRTMQDEKKLRGEIRNYIFEYFLFGYEEDELKDDMSFLDLGVLDSTGIMELVAYIQRQYKIKVKDEEIIPDNLDSVNAITSFIIKKEEEACS